MRFNDFRVTVEKRTAKTERLERMAQTLTLSTPKHVAPPHSEVNTFGVGTHPNPEILHPIHNRGSRRGARGPGRRTRVPGVALTEKPWSKGASDV